jgi:hypothetical protein
MLALRCQTMYMRVVPRACVIRIPTLVVLLQICRFKRSAAGNTTCRESPLICSSFCVLISMSSPCISLLMNLCGCHDFFHSSH